MISSENLVCVVTVLTERKLKLCNMIKHLLEKENIHKTEDEIVKAVSCINNNYFLTHDEINSQKISSKSIPIKELLTDHPNILTIIYRELF